MGPLELCGACQWLVGFLELSRSKMEGCPKPSIARLKTQHFHYGSGQAPAHAAPGPALLAKSKQREGLQRFQGTFRLAREGVPGRGARGARSRFWGPKFVLEGVSS